MFGRRGALENQREEPESRMVKMELAKALSREKHLILLRAPEESFRTHLRTT